MLLREWEINKKSFIKELFDRLAFMTIHGKIGYQEAKKIPNWERRMYMEAVGRMVEEKRKATGGLSDLLE